MAYVVNITDDALKFINSLDIKLKAKTLRTIGLLEEFGPFLSLPHSKKIVNYDQLYEMRISQGSNLVRLFYFNLEGKIYIITSGYIKKDQKLKKSELEKAAKIMHEIKENKNEIT